MIRVFLIIMGLLLVACKGGTQDSIAVVADSIVVPAVTPAIIDTLEKHSTGNKYDKDIVISDKMPEDIFCDVDGDAKQEKIGLRLDSATSKYGLVIQYGTGKIDTLGMGKDVLDQGFDNFNWAGIMEVAPKGKYYFNNVDEEGEILTEDQVLESEKIKLKNDGILVHEAESCGGGVIYLTDKNKYAWIQQE